MRSGDGCAGSVAERDVQPPPRVLVAARATTPGWRAPTVSARRSPAPAVVSAAGSVSRAAPALARGGLRVREPELRRAAARAPAVGQQPEGRGEKRAAVAGRGRVQLVGGRVEHRDRLLVARARPRARRGGRAGPARRRGARAPRPRGRGRRAASRRARPRRPRAARPGGGTRSGAARRRAARAPGAAARRARRARPPRRARRPRRRGRASNGSPATAAASSSAPGAGAAARRARPPSAAATAGGTEPSPASSPRRRRGPRASCSR